MHNYYRSGRRDLNEKEIKQYLVEQAIPFIQLLPGQGADWIVLLQREVIFVEVKNPETSLVRQQLTETEKKLQDLCDVRHIRYVVVFTVEDMKEQIELASFEHSAQLNFLGLVSDVTA